MATKRVAIVPARGNSKGIPRKNLRSVGGRPLLWYTIEAAVGTGLFDEIVVSSECPEILEYAVGLGAVPCRRPAHLAEDDVHSVHVVLDIIERRELAADTVVTMLLPTSPLRTAHDIANACRAFEATWADSLVSVYRDSSHLLQFRRIGPDGLLMPLVGGDPNAQRQDVQGHYVVNGSIYVSTAGALLLHESFHRGRVVPFVMERHRSLDVNTFEDLVDVERMMSA